MVFRSKCLIHCRNSRKFNNGVYRAYFSRSQEGYDAAAKDVFEALDMVKYFSDS